MLPFATPILAALLAAETAAAAASPPLYIIGAGDVLAVHVWKQPEVTRRMPVRPDGKISLPLLNDVQAAGMAPNQLASALGEALKRYITEPDVSVVVEQINSKKFYVMGEVARPGAYPLLSTTSVLQALIAAGGFRDFANTKKIQVLRGSQRLAFDYPAVVKGKQREQNVMLENGDTVVVP